ncbi:MAG: SDR family oxidoreductase [Candidatus Pacebacteria bacterium]|nr:SDR family oxidoreductase [Candidatus Paceibacterota bacterium]
MFDLTGKTVLVAGGAGYLGQPICTGLAEQGASVVVADMAGERARQLVAQIREKGGSAEAVALDVADQVSSEDTVKKTVDTYGRLDVLVNATFASIGKRVEDLTAEEFDRTNRINLTGAFILARAAADAMPSGGSIIFFSSMYGRVSPDPRIYHAPMNPNPIEYGVGKAGVIQMAKYLAVYWGPRGIRVNVVAPGPFPNPDVQAGHPDFISRLADRVPLGRIGRQNEMAGTIVFLASDASTYLNGATIGVDGGWTAW